MIGDLSALVYLTLRSITLQDLGIFRRLRQLRSLALKLGGTNQLALLNELSSLRYLELWQVRGLSDLSVSATLPTAPRPFFARSHECGYRQSVHRRHLH